MTVFRVRHITSLPLPPAGALRRASAACSGRATATTSGCSHAELERDARQPSAVRWIHDVFGNCVALVDIRPARRDELRFETRIRLEHTPQAEPDLQIDAAALTYPFAYDPEEAADLAPTIRPHYPDAEVRPLGPALRAAPGGRTETGQLLMTLCYAIHESFVYSRRHEPGTQPPAVTLQLRRGTCRDFALLMMEAVRSARVRGALRHRLRLRPRPRRRRRRAAAARPMPGARSTCRAPAGWSSTRPTASSATATSSGWRWPATRARRCRSAAAIDGSAEDFAGDDGAGEGDHRAGGEARRLRDRPEAPEPAAPADVRCAFADLGARQREEHPTMRIRAGYRARLRVPAADADAAGAEHPSRPPAPTS